MDALDRAATYLANDGQRYARRLTDRYRLPGAFAEDLSQEALLAVHRRMTSGRPIDNVEAFVNTVLRRRAVDLVRGELRRPAVDRRAHDDDHDLLDIADDDVDLPELDIVAAAELTTLRAAVARRLGHDALSAAGALAVLAHLDPLDPADAAHDCPRPAGGATETEAANWVGLFYAGRRGWWPDSRPDGNDEHVGNDGHGGNDGDDARPASGDTAAIRKRRSRWATSLRQLLHDSAAELGIHPGGDRG